MSPDDRQLEERLAKWREATAALGSPPGLVDTLRARLAAPPDLWALLLRSGRVALVAATLVAALSAAILYQTNQRFTEELVLLTQAWRAP